ncbi:Ig-like domain-containing protein, partial [Rhizobium sp. AAP43]|uniref:Ig-like domain-containing protein n=1 Tax=Rhizobium sp. AAP43 TaxID=1523420 RepID=UPI0006CDAC7C
VVTPDSGFTGNLTVGVAAGVATDAAANQNTAAAFVQAVDTAPPTATISFADVNLTQGETSLVTITFSEKVTGFSNADLNIQGGNLSPVSSSDGKTWTATFTPTANLNDATNVITLASGSVFDLAGNANASATQSANYAIDTRPPNLTPTDIIWNAVDPGSSFPSANTKIASLSVTDPDNTGGYTYELVTGAGVTVNASGEVFTTGAIANNAAYAIEVKVTDARGGSYNETFNIIGGTGSDNTLPSAGEGAPVLAGDDILYGQNNADTIYGGNADDTLFGQDGNDTLVGGTGRDTLYGGSGSDTLTGGSDADAFSFASSDSQGSVSMPGGLINGVTGYDVITDFVVGVDKLKLPVSGVAAANTAGTNGFNSDYSTDGTRFESHSISNGIVRFDDQNTFSQARNIDSLVEVGMALDYLKSNNLGVAGATVAFQAVISGVTYTFVYQQGGATAGANHTFVALQGTAISNFNDVLIHSAADPIILDLDKNGFALSSIGDGVTFDINADGHKDQIAWTSDDGILAYDVDGNGLIDNGSEIFTPDFKGETFASGVAALASLDSNGDGKIDANDQAFAKLQVWVDADNDGVSDQGELSSLSDHGVASISLTTDNTGGVEDGQTVFSEGSFTFLDGSEGDFLEVGFDTIFGSDLSDPLIVTGTDGNDVLHGGMGQVMMTGGAGADTFVFDETALHELDVADVITDYSLSEGDVLDVSALLDTLLGEQRSEADAASHVKLSTDGTDTTLSVDMGDSGWKDVVVLENHTTSVKVLFDDTHSVTVNPDVHG